MIITSAVLYAAKNWHEKRVKNKLQTWARKVKRKDKHRCTICGSKKKLQAHHINSKAYFWWKKYDVSNGTTLCERHHTKNAKLYPSIHIWCGGTKVTTTARDLQLYKEMIFSKKYTKTKKQYKKQMSKKENLIAFVVTVVFCATLYVFYTK